MAASYTVLPVTSEVIEWLESQSNWHPKFSREGRYPTINELRQVLDGLDSCTIKYSVSDLQWQAVVSDSADNWANLVILHYNGHESDDQLHREFFFDHGSLELMKKILKNLSTICGPFVLVSAADLEPIIIVPD